MWVFSGVYYLLFLLTALYLYVKQKHSYWENAGVSGPRPRFLIGHSVIGMNISVNQLVNDLYKDFKRKGQLFGMYFWTKPVAVITDLNVIKRIMITDFDYFMDRGVYYNEKDDPLSAHLFALAGKKWRKLRMKLTPTFTSGKMKLMFPIIVEISKHFQTAINKTIEENPDGFEIKSLTSRFTTDVIGTCAFGIECNSLVEPDNLFRKVGDITFMRNFFRAVRSNFAMTFPNLARKLRIISVPTEVSEFYMKTVKDTITHRETTNTKRHDFMDLLIDLKNSPKNEEKLTVEEIGAQSFIFFLAGFETSSSTMMFCLYELAKNLDIQEKTRKNIEEQLKKHNNVLTYECLHDMTYLEQVIKETLRKYPIVSVLNRIVTKEKYEIPEMKLTLKNGTLILIPAYGIQNDPEIYENPDKFDPNRFSEENEKKIHPCAYLPFGEGPRICIGLRFGMMQAKIGLVALLSQFTFSPNKDTPTELEFSRFSTVLVPKNGIHLKVEKIK